jgi:transcriptional regulator with XRE-family HTH domain
MAIGQRIRELRTERTPKLTQDALAEKAGISADVIKKLEQGVKNTARITTLMAIANALDVDLAVLIGKPIMLDGVPDTGGLLALRRVLTPIDQLTTAGDDVSAELADAWRLYWTGDYDRLTAVLPGIIADARGDQLAEAHALAASVLVFLGHCDLALLALADAQNRVSNPLLRASLMWTKAWVLLCQGRPDDGAKLALRVADEMEPRRDDPPEHTSAWGLLLVTAATGAVRAGDRAQADDLLRSAHGAAVRLGEDRLDLQTAFGVSKVVMMTVDCAVVAGDYVKALDAAAQMPTHHSLPLASRARHMTDVAHAHARLGHYGEAEQLLLRIEQAAPRWLRYQVFPKAVVSDLLQGPKPTRDLRGLAHRLSVAV